MSQHVNIPSEEEKKALPVSELEPTPAGRVHRPFSKMGVLTCFVLISMSLLFFSGQIVTGLVQTNAAAASTAQAIEASQTTTNILESAGATPTPTSRSASPVPLASVPATPATGAYIPFFLPPDNATPAPLQLDAGEHVLYQNATHVYIASTTDKSVEPIYTPGYNYNEAVRPLLTPDSKLLYTGLQGIWLTGVFNSQPVQLAQFPANTTITSLALSQDGQMLAWSTEPTDGNGQAEIYAGPLTNPQLIRQQSTLNCPCFRIFSFLNGSGTNASTTLLLTDDRGSNEAVQYGLWALDITDPSADPQLIIDEDPQQGPLALMPSDDTLLYSTYEGAVPVPTDNSVPADVAAMSFADSLSITTLSGSPLLQGNAQVILPEQHNLANSAQYHWVTTPTFSPDGSTLAYVEFSSDSQPPYDRYSALYTVQVSGSGDQLQASKPQLVAVATTRLLELGPWINSHVITMYGDNAIYALDVQNGALTTLAQGGGYLRGLSVIGAGQ